MRFGIMLVVIIFGLIILWSINTINQEAEIINNADEFCIEEGYEEAGGPRFFKYCQKVVGNSIIQRPIKELDGKYYWVDKE